MAPKDRYVLRDFTKYAQEAFPTEFASVADHNIYKFEDKTCIDNNGDASDNLMLTVGTYYKKDGGVWAWACVTESGISYYYGKPGRVCQPVPDAFRSRIYHSYPFDLMMVSEGLNSSSHGKDPTQSVKQLVIEAAISFAFLSHGYAKHVVNHGKNDMLNKFKFACISFHKNSGSQNLAEPLRSRDTPMAQAMLAGCNLADNTSVPVPETRALRPSSSSSPGISSHTEQATEMAEEIEMFKTKLTTWRSRSIKWKGKYRVQKDERRISEARLEARIAELKTDIKRIRGEMYFHKKESCRYRSLYDGVVREQSRSEKKRTVRSALPAFDVGGDDMIKVEFRD